VVHRDVKPENILLGEDGALVADFGVAKALGAAAARDGVTGTGVALGTPNYMAPEQVAADPHVDHRADVYALGVVAYEMLAGEPPFTGASPHQVLAAHATRTPEPLARRRPSVPPALAALVMRCLEKRAADRPQSAEEVLRELETAISAPPPLPKRASVSLEKVAQVVASAASAPRRHKVAVGAAFVLLAAGGGAAILSADRGSVELAPGRAARLTVDPGLELDPVLSPDGRARALRQALRAALEGRDGIAQAA
jgi:serine/threonine-protein kinase